MAQDTPPIPGTKPTQNPETTGIGQYFPDSLNWVGDVASTALQEVTKVWSQDQQTENKIDWWNATQGGAPAGRQWPQNPPTEAPGNGLSTRSLLLIGVLALGVFAIAR